MSRTRLRQFAFALPTAAVGLAALASAPAAAAPTDPLTQAACDFGWQLTTYDFTNYEDYDRRVLDRSTGQFHDQFANSSADRRAHAETAHTHSEAVAVECRTDTADPDHAQMVVSIDQSTRSDATLGFPHQTRTILRVSLDNVDGRWLASRVDPVPPPPPR
ncbi:hypothetical protein [Nocardia transvalensis]|uniref:hypothetical protein n=1 Tax=Nocardia transvalensis TaxID=37333 RepID=UPI0018956471|nr:hypothetical protein [Nocardia transvalensis]MBF6330060.1 hypothetical protein [Nocardia transvalensis]